MAKDRQLQTTTIEHGSTGAPGGDMLLVAGPGRLTTHPLTGGAAVIGRADDCDVVIDHRALSRKHARLVLAPQLAVQDLGSTNGTRVGNAVMKGGEPAALATGECFYIGPFSFMVVASRADVPSSRMSGQDRLVVPDPTPEGVSSLVREIAKSGVNVLIQGETGVGKDVLASTLHAISGRTGPLSRINCAALSETLLESELFGHEKGAFTGAVSARAGLLEAAAGGSVFLDEIGEMPLAIQAKLLRAVEAREVIRLGSTRAIAIDVRFLAATNRDLPSEVAAGRFRHDLYFRLDGVSLRIPPLRERDGAIAPLALALVADASKRAGREVRTSPDLIAALEAHDWPGNVRELKAVLERAVLLARGEDLAPRHLAFSPRPPAAPTAPAPVHPAVVPPPPAAPAEDLSFLTAEQRADREKIMAALAECVGNQTRAAKLLDISRTTLVNKMALYRIPRPRV
jgi:two-component system, NtrC family, response regulator AtoC